MQVELDFTKGVNENAAALYDEAKKLREKAKGAEKAAAETERKLAELGRKMEAEAAKPAGEGVRVKRERQWFERFRWFRSAGGFLCIAGRDAKQNEILVARHLSPGDLFFHADVHGAPATVLKGGEAAPEADRREAAQFSGSYSSAWKTGTATVDVYAVKPEQVSKRAESGEFAGKGGFIIRGEREWFRSTPLELILASGGKGLEVLPGLAGKRAFRDAAVLRPGGKEKGEAAKAAAKILGTGASMDEILQALPSGGSAVSPA
jgi:predicted ribosome quality control (RQC) complex YloA/Tae2 family protein